MRIAIIGAGGHAKVVADAILAAGHDQIFGFLDDDPMRWGTSVIGHVVRGGTDTWSDPSIDAFVVAIGDNARRKRLFDRLKTHDAAFASVAHPSATLAGGASLGEGAVVLAHAYVGVDTRVGPNCILNTGCTVDHDCTVGAHSHLAPGVTIAGGVRLGEGVFAGTGAKIIPGISVGDWAIIGAGAVVTSDVTEGITVVGVPARDV